jgi:hypothetical protein
MARNTYYQTAHYRALKQATHDRDGWRCTVPGCGSTEGLVCEHIETRPNVSHPTRFDTLANTTTLCGLHDRQTKEQANGKRRNDGKYIVSGCSPDGTPRDPSHPWHRGRGQISDRQTGAYRSGASLSVSSPRLNPRGRDLENGR